MDATDATRHARLRADAEAIFRAAVDRVDPREMIRSRVGVRAGELVVETEQALIRRDLSDFDRVIVLGFGKAGARMALGLEDVLGGRIDAGLVAVKTGYLEHLERIRILEASHPVPDAASVAASREILSLARAADERTLVLVLISGGGSAILCAPYDDGRRALTLKDKAAVTRELLACGADIRQINTVRRHLSAVKGGRLAAALAPAAVVSLVLSDVIGDDLASIASGPTSPDPTTWKDAWDVVERFGIADRIPAAARNLLEDGAGGQLPDTPKPGDPAFARVENIILGSNRQAAAAARNKAIELGYGALNLGSRFFGEARETAGVWLGLGLESAETGIPVAAPGCVVGGGETTVTLRGSGLGGRNQEAALAFLAGLAEADPGTAGRVCFLSAGTDGGDGPTDAAGAFADLEILGRARDLDLDPRAFLANNDSYHFLDRTGALLRTGPTNTNVCDIQVLLVR